MSTDLYQVQAFIEQCMEEGKEGTLKELVEQDRREREEVDSHFRDIERTDVRFDWNGTNHKRHD